MIGRRTATAGALAALLPASSRAQAAWPTKPIRLIVPYGPGGSADQVARLYAERLSAALGQQVIVEDKPGASGGVGAAMVATSAPDGYTFLLAPTAILAITPGVRQVPYKPDDLVAVCRLSTALAADHHHQRAGRQELAGVRGVGQGQSRQVLVRLVGPRHHHASHRRGADPHRRHQDAARALQDHRRRHRRHLRRPHPDGVRSLVRGLRQGRQGAHRADRRADAARRSAGHADGAGGRAGPEGLPRPRLVRPVRAQGPAAGHRPAPLRRGRAHRRRHRT